MTYLLDTNTCIRYINQTNEQIIRQLQRLSPDDVKLCDVVKFELYYGAYNSARRDANLVLLQLFFDEFESLPFDGRSAEVCGRVRAQLRSRGTPIGAYDLQIAAIAVVHGLTLVTHNVGEFSRVEALQFEDWEREGGSV
jgi:tRNA(fMet)-specific endonuclease VapC